MHHCARRSGRDRRTVRRWGDWLREHRREFSFCLRSRWPESGRVAEFESFWRNVIDELSSRGAHSAQCLIRERLDPQL